MFALCAAVTRAHAQSGEIKLTAHDAAKSDAFGAAVAAVAVGNLVDICGAVAAEGWIRTAFEVGAANDCKVAPQGDGTAKSESTDP